MKRHEPIFEAIVAEQLTRPEVDIGPMFGTEGLRVRSKVYAFIAAPGTLVAKLPSERIDELAGSGATRMVMRGSELREWVEVPAATGAELWATIVDEARQFVEKSHPRPETT